MKQGNRTQTAQNLLDFIDRCPTPFHAVEEMSARLTAKKFRKLDEAERWKIEPGGGYFVTRNDSSLIAFRSGARTPEQAGFKIIGAHTDSPALRLKPNPVIRKNGYALLGVEVYGGVLLTTWTDRDLSLAGRVVLRAKKSGPPVTRLFNSSRAVARIPQLAIHLNRSVNEKGLVLNPQTHLPAILSVGGENSPCPFRDLVASELGCKAGDVLAFDLSLHDAQKSSFGGAGGEFIYAPRLDNLASCHAALAAFLDANPADPATQVLVFYDHEEVGSQTAQGGESPFLRDALERISGEAGDALPRAIANSFCISADMAHAAHPNYSDTHEPNHLPAINGGPVIKYNAAQRYATDSASSAVFELLCERAGVKTQKFVMRADLACGSTIGPITAAKLGVRTVDVGNPMLAMHSAREMAGTDDHAELIKVFKEFFKPGAAAGK